MIDFLIPSAMAADGGGGGGTYRMDGSGEWIGAGGANPLVDWDGDRITYRMALADLGLELGDTFNFDIGTRTLPAIDDTSPESIRKLKQLGTRLVEQDKKELDKLVSLLLH